MKLKGVTRKVGQHEVVTPIIIGLFLSFFSTTGGNFAKFYHAKAFSNRGTLTLCDIARALAAAGADSAPSPSQIFSIDQKRRHI